LSLGALAASERVQPPSMTRTVQCLDEAGMVVRRAHPDDRRQVVLQVSKRGLDLLDSERRRRDAWLAQRLDAYSAEQRELLRQALPLLDELAQW
jgi:DNA-binding MarR family transcriptional regulator